MKSEFHRFRIKNRLASRGFSVALRKRRLWEQSTSCDVIHAHDQDSQSPHGRPSLFQRHKPLGLPLRPERRQLTSTPTSPSSPRCSGCAGSGLSPIAVSSLLAFVRIRSRNIFSPTLIYPKRVLSIKSANLKVVPERQKTIRSSETEIVSELVKRVIIALGVVVKCPMTEIAIPKKRDFWSKI